jgi:G protein beta subunit-like protein
VALHPNQAELLSGDHAGTIRSWDLAANKCSLELVPEGQDTPISGVSIAADASVFVASNYNGACYVWRPQSSEEFVPLRRIQAHKAYITSCKLSSDVRYLATASNDRTVKVWNMHDLTLATTLVGHARWVWDCAFSADGSYLATASSDQSARLWEVSSGEAVRTYTGHGKAVTAVALNDAAPVPVAAEFAPSLQSQPPAAPLARPA